VTRIRKVRARVVIGRFIGSSAVAWTVAALLLVSSLLHFPVTC